MLRMGRRPALAIVLAYLLAACTPAALPSVAPSASTAENPSSTSSVTPGPSTSEAPQAAADLATIRVISSPTGLNGFLMRVAADKGLFAEAGVIVQQLAFGEAEDNVLLLSGAIDFASLAPIDVALMRNDGADVVNLGGLFNQHSTILVKADDPRTLAQLKGTKHGQIGLGSTTSRQLQVLLKVTDNIDYVSFFENVVSGTPTLEPLLARGDVESIAMFPPRNIVYEASGAYRPVYGPISQEWEKVTGHPLLLGGIAMDESFVRANPEATRRFVAGLRKTAEYIEANADAVVQEYASLFGFEDETATKAFAAALKEGDFFDIDLSAERVAAEQRFLQEAQKAGVLTQVPDELFFDMSGL